MELDQSQNGNGKKLAWYDRKVKVKLTVAGIVLITIAFYLVVFLKLPLEYFVYYAAFVSLFVGVLSAADVMNTLSYNKAKQSGQGGS